jgi:hypothetical protein
VLDVKPSVPVTVHVIVKSELSAIALLLGLVVTVNVEELMLLSASDLVLGYGAICCILLLSIFFVSLQRHFDGSCYNFGNQSNALPPQVGKPAQASSSPIYYVCLQRD